MHVFKSKKIQTFKIFPDNDLHVVLLSAVMSSEFCMKFSHWVPLNYSHLLFSQLGLAPSPPNNVRMWAHWCRHWLQWFPRVSGLKWHYVQSNLLFAQIKSFLQPASQPRESQRSKSVFSAFIEWISALLSEQMDCFQHLELMNKS